jgi:hypothetical protein
MKISGRGPLIQALSWTACLILVCVYTQSTGSICQAQDTSGFKAIFDGSSLKGWEGAEGFWSVEDGAITGQFTEDNPLKSNTFLVWRGGKVGNFHLKLEFRLTAGNSGIQYRSQEMDNFVVGGYQADIDFGKQWVGILYDERGRGILATRMQSVTIDDSGEKAVKTLPGEEAKFLEKYQPAEWNTYEIIAEGNQLKHVVNGITTVEVLDEQSAASESEGILAFQLHTGPPMKVQFKNVMLKQIEK